MKRNRLYRFGAAITAALLCAAFSAQAAVPAVINYQSRLRTAGGVAIKTATKVSFSLYSAATGGTALWTESYSQSSGACAKVMPDSNGYFSVQMGSCEAFPSTLTFTTPLYLGVTIENDAEATPRVAFAPAPYAMNAVRVGNFVSDTSAGTLTGEPLGTATAGTQGFHSAGLLLQGSGWNGSAAASKGFKVRTTATDASNYRLSILDSSDGSESVSILNNGRVGIGITNPQSELEVAGVIYANDFRTRGGSISTTGDGTNDLIRFTRPKLLVGFTSDLNNPTSNLKSLMSLTSSDVTFLEETSFNKLVSFPNRQVKFGANTFTFPVAAPATDGLVLTTDTDGTLSWTSKSSGSVTSVGLSAPADFTVTGSPVTDAGTLGFAWKTQQPNDIFAGPASGALAGTPSFRNLVPGDIPSLDAGKITSGVFDVPRGGTGITTYSKGQIVYSDAINSLAALGLGGNGTVLTANTVTGLPEWKAIPATAGGTVTSVSATIPSSLLTLSGSPITDSGTLAFDLATQSANEVFVGPLTGTAKPTFRGLSAVDIPALDAAKITTGTLAVTRGGTGIAATAKGDILFSDAINSLAALGIGTTGKVLTVNSAGLPEWKDPATNGTVTSVGLTSTSPLFSAFGAPVTGSGTISVNIANQEPNEFFAGPPSGATAAAPAFRQLVATDIPNLSASQVVSGVFDPLRIPELSADKITSGVFSIDRIPEIPAGSVTGTLAVANIPNLSADKITSGVFDADRIPVVASSSIPNLDASKITSGIFDIPRGGTGLSATAPGDILFSDAINSLARLGIGATDQILTVNSAGLPVWRAPATNGTVTSVGITVPSILTVSGSPVTGSGDLALDLANQEPNEVFVGPVSGQPAKPLFRSLVSLDIPDLTAAKITSGTFGVGLIPELSADKITSGTLGIDRIPEIPVAKVTGVVPVAQIPDLGAEKITSGVFDVARIPTLGVSQIPDLSADKITSGILSPDRVPVLDIATKTSGTLGVTRGGTGIAATAKGDILFSDAINSLAALGIGSEGKVLTANGTTGLPEWRTASGDISGNGAANSIAFFTGAKTIANSLISQTGGNIDITSGNLQLGGVTRIAANGNATFTTTTITDATIAAGTLTNVKIDGATIGGTTAGAGTFTNLAASNLTATNITGTNISATNVAATNLSASGAMTLGDSSSDVLNIKASIGSDIIPSPTNLRVLGSATSRFANLFTDKINVAGVTTFNGIGYSWPVAAPATNGRVLTSATDGTLSWGVPNDGTVTSVALSAPSIFTVAGSPVTATGTLAFDLSTQSKNKVFAGPESDPDAKPSFRALVAGDIPSLPASQITSGVFASSTIPTLDASKIGSGKFGIAQGGTNITAYAKGDILFSDAINSLAALGIGSTGKILTVSSAGLPAWQDAPATGVTSVGLSMPSFFNVASSPVTASGTIAVTLGNQLSNTFFAGPAAPVAAPGSQPSFRGLDPLDIPDLSADKITSGVFAAARIPAIATSSVPDLDASKITSGTFGVARGGTGLSTVGAAGTVLTSVGGVPAWQAVPAGLSGSGVFGQLAFWNASSTLAGNSKIIIDNTNSRLAIGTSATPATTLVVAGDTTVGGDVVPSTASAYDFGSTTKPVRSVYSDNLGSATQRIKAAYIDELYIYGGAGGSGTSTISATQTVFNGIAYNWPNGGLGNNFVLTTDTNGNLGWQNPTSLVPESGWRSLAGNIRLGVITDKVGIGTATPATKLDVVGDIQASGFLSSGSGQIKFGGATYNFPTTLGSAGQVLTASSSGALAWQTPASGISGLGTANYVPLWNGTSTMGNSMISQFGSNFTIGAGTGANISIGNGSDDTIFIGGWIRPEVPGGVITVSGSMDLGVVAGSEIAIKGGFKIPAGAGVGKILTSDDAGYATWQSASASGIGGSGTINKLALFSATGTIADSVVSQSAGTVTVGGGLSVTGVASFATTTIGRLALPNLGAGAGKVLTSDDVGNAMWQTPAAGGSMLSGVVGKIPYFNTSSTLASSFITTTATTTAVASGIMPATDNIYDLGSPTARWRSVYVGPSTIHITDSNGNEVGGLGAGTGANVGKIVARYGATEVPIQAVSGIPSSVAAGTALLAPIGATGAPAFRALTALDIPSLDVSKITTGTLPVTNGGTGLSSVGTNGQVLTVSNGVLSWQTPAVFNPATLGATVPLLGGNAGLVSGMTLGMTDGDGTQPFRLLSGGQQFFSYAKNSFDGSKNAFFNSNLYVSNPQGQTGKASAWIDDNLNVAGTTSLGDSATDTTFITGKLRIGGGLPGQVLTVANDGYSVWQSPGGGDTQNKNTFTGFEAGKSTASGAGYNNVGNGYQALYSNGGGYSNVAVGRFALMANTNGGENTAVGDTALQYATASNNTAIGSRALKANGTGNNNTAVGQSSLDSNVNGGGNTAVGVGSLHLNASGNSNTALGRVALQSNGGNFNTGVGDSALSLLATGSQNVAVGGFTGGVINNMSDAVLVGYNAGQGSPNGLTNVIAVGSGAQFTKSNQAVIGNASITETLLRGTVKANGVTLTSDRRLKENITKLDPVLTKLGAISGVNFTWKDGKIKGKQLGVIAQDVEKSFPELVDTDSVTGMKSVNYSGLAAVAIQGVKELDAKVEAAAPVTGEGVIRPGESEVLVFTSQASTGAKIFVTPLGSTGGQTLYVDKVVGGEYFTVKTDRAVRSPARFNWMIIK